MIEEARQRITSLRFRECGRLSPQADASCAEDHSEEHREHDGGTDADHEEIATSGVGGRQDRGAIALDDREETNPTFDRDREGLGQDSIRAQRGVPADGFADADDRGIACRREDVAREESAVRCREARGVEAVRPRELVQLSVEVDAPRGRDGLGREVVRGEL